MESMTEFELVTFLKMILEILYSTNDIQEVRKKIEALLER